MSKVFNSIIASGFADIVSAAGFVGSNLVGASIGGALDRLAAGRAERARTIFLEELGQGLRPPRDAGEIDEFVSIVYRYMSKAAEGAARLNLRLMAKVARGQLEGEGLYASEFLRYSEMIASLTREEVILLATRFAVRREYEAAKKTSDWNDTSKINDVVRDRLVPSVFPTGAHMTAALTALQRTGLVWPAAATLGGGYVWQDTPLLDHIVCLAGFEAALATEAN